MITLDDDDGDDDDDDDDDDETWKSERNLAAVLLRI